MALDSGWPLEPGVPGVDGQVKTTAAELRTAMSMFYPEDSHSPSFGLLVLIFSFSSDIHCQDLRQS